MSRNRPATRLLASISMLLSVLVLAPSSVVVAAPSVTAAINFDGRSTPTAFDGNDDPGNDSGPNNGIVRTGDTVGVTYAMTFDEASTDVVLDAVAPTGSTFAIIPLACGAGSSLSSSDTVLACNLADQANGNTLSINAEYVIANTLRQEEDIDFDFSLTTAEAGTVTSAKSPSIVVSAAPEWNIFARAGSNPSIVVQPDESFRVSQGFQLFTRSDNHDGTGVGSAALEAGQTLTVRFAGLVRNITADEFGCSGPFSCALQPDGTLQVTTTTALSRNVVLGVSLVLRPDAFPAAGGNFSATVESFDPTTPTSDGTPQQNFAGAGEDTTDNTAGRGFFPFRLVNSNRMGGPNTNVPGPLSLDGPVRSTLNNGLVPIGGNTVYASTATNLGITEPSEFRLCAGIDNRRLVLQPEPVNNVYAQVQTGGSAITASLDVSDFTIEYGTGGKDGAAGPWGGDGATDGQIEVAMQAMRCADADSADGWFDDPVNVPGGPAAITRVRAVAAPGARFTPGQRVYLGIYADVAPNALNTDGSARGAALFHGGSYCYVQTAGDALQCRSDGRFDVLKARIGRGDLGITKSATNGTSTTPAVVEVFAGNNATFTLSPTNTTIQPLDELLNTVVSDIIVTDTLPVGLSYVPGSASPNVPTVTPNGDGTTTLEFDLGARVMNDVITPITFEARVETSVPDLTVLTNVVTIDSPDSWDSSMPAGNAPGRAELGLDASVPITARQAASISVTLDTSTPFIEVGDTGTYEVEYANLGSSPSDTVQRTDLIFLLPYAASPAPNTSTLTKVVELVGVVAAAPNDGTNPSTGGDPEIYVSSTDPSTLDGIDGNLEGSVDPGYPGQAGYLQEGAGDFACLISEVGSAGCPATLADVTAVRVLSDGGDGQGGTPALGPSEGGTVQISVTTVGQSQGDELVGRARTITDPVIFPASFTPANATILVGALSVGDLVYEDVDGDSRYTAGTDVGINDVRVELLDAAGTNVLQFTTTQTINGQPGRYLFSGLNGGDYRIRIPSSEFDTAADALFGWIGSSLSTSTASTNPRPPLDEEVDHHAIGDMPETTGFTTEAFTLELGLQAQSEDDDSIDPNRDRDSDLTVDFALTGPSRVTGTAWSDLDRDGIREAGDDPLAGVEVTLFDLDGDTVAGPVSTGPDGRYDFAGVDASLEYTVVFDASGLDRAPTLQDQGGDDAVDSDADAAGIAVAPALSQATRTYDIGIQPLAEVVVSAWFDITPDGVNDTAGAEAPSGGRSVELFDITNGVTVATSATDATTGQVTFDGLSSGDYQVRTALPTGGEVPTTPGQGADPTLDSDIAEVDGDTAVFTVASSQVFPIGVGVIAQPTITVTAIDTETNEAGDTGTVSIVLDVEPRADVTVPVSVTDTGEGSLAVASVTFTPQNWDTPQIVTITGVDDAIVDGPITHRLVTGDPSSTDPSYDGVDAADVADIDITNLDNDVAGIVVTVVDAQTGEDGTNTATVRFSLTGEPTADVTIPLSVSDATEGSLGAVTQVVITAAGYDDPTANEVTITGVDDDVIDGDIEFQLVTGDPTSPDAAYDALGAADATDPTITNLDDDTAAVIVTTVDATTGEDGATATVRFELTAEPTGDVTIPLTVTDATEGSIGFVSTIIITPANWNQPTINEVTITGVDDPIIDGDIAFVLTTGDPTSSDPAFDALGAGDVADPDLVNVDDDAASVIVTVVDAESSEGSATDTAVVQFSLATQPSAAVTIALAIADTTEGSFAADPTSTPTSSITIQPADWNDPTANEVTIFGLADVLTDGNQTYVLETGAPTGEPSYAALGAGDVTDPTITNLDGDSASIIVNAIDVQTAEDGSTASIQFSLTSQPTGDADVSIPVTIADGSEGSFTSPTAGELATTVVIANADWDQPADNVIVIYGVDENIDDGDITHLVSTGDPTSAAPEYEALDAAATTDVNITNVDDDATGVIVRPIDVVTSENDPANTAVFEFELLSEPTAPVTIPLGLAPSDEQTGPATITIAPADWNVPTNNRVTFVGVDDDIIDGDIVVTVETAAPSAPGDATYDLLEAGDVADPTSTNLDDDIAGVIVAVVDPISSEDGTRTASVTFELTAQPASPVTIPLSVDDASEASLGVVTEIVIQPADWNVAANNVVTIEGVDDDLGDGDIAYQLVTGDPASASAPFDALTATDVDDPDLVNLDDEVVAVVVTVIDAETSESGDTATVQFSLTARPTGPVTIPLSISDATEGTLGAVTSIVIDPADWDQPASNVVVITGVADTDRDGTITYTLVTGDPTSSDSAFEALTAGNVDDATLTNADVTVLADLVLTVGPAVTLVPAGPSGELVFTVTNDGPDVAMSSILDVTLPDGVTLAATSGAAGALASADVCSASDGVASCELGTIAVESVVEVTFSLQVVDPSAPPATVTGDGVVGATTPDPDLDNNEVAGTIIIEPVADLAVSAEPLPDGTPGPGFTLTLSNAGPSNGDATVTFELPSGVTLRPGSSEGCTVSGTTVTCAAGALEPNGFATFTVLLDAAADATVSISVDGPNADPDAANNTTTFQVQTDTPPPPPTPDLPATGGEGGSDVLRLGVLAMLIGAAALLVARLRRRDRQLHPVG